MDLSDLFRQLVGAAPAAGPPQAVTRVTRTPVRWGALAPDTFGQYFPADHSIVMNQTTMPQSNPNPEYMSNILRHESVHALMPPATVDSITKYLSSNPATAATGREALSKYAPDAGTSNRGLAQEAPAYAVQGYRFGMPDSMVQEYLRRMPPDVRAKYLMLLHGGGQQ